MDLHHIDASPTADEIAAIEAVLGEAVQGPSGLREVDGVRHQLLPALRSVQSGVGWISPGALGEICRRLSVPPAEAWGVATFYALLATEPQPPVVLHACDDVACKARGADREIAALQAARGAEGEVSNAGTWHRSPCLGLCEQAPAALLQVAGSAPFERSFGAASAEAMTAALDRRAASDPRPPVLHQPRESLRLLARVGVVDPSSIHDYRAHGGYQALRAALAMGPDAVIREVTESRLQGRGGAAFPTGRKWAAVAAQPVRPHWLVCNADESEPGTFKDRIVMEWDPFAVVEAMTIAGFATGCERGIVYVRGEYPLAAERLTGAIERARAQGLLGDDVMGKGVTFDIEVRRGAGAYICGEETALFNSIEGYRGEPRSKPPFPVEVGLFGKPTVVNNVETLVNVLPIVLAGGAEYARTGTEGSTGTRLFCLSGQVEKPGIYEVPCGTRLSELLRMAGGVAGGRGLGAILLGGAAGTFVGPADLEMPLSFEDARKAGATLGSGVVLVLDDATDVVPYLRRIAAFFRDESCGQCVPCRVGTVRQEELLARIEHAGRAPSASDRLVLRELSQCMRDASICGLGQTASSALESAVARLGVFGGDAR